MNQWHEHPARFRLNDEVHARPYEELTPPERLIYLVFLVDERARAEEWTHLERLCHLERITLPPPSNHVRLDFGHFRLKVERHEEFTRYTFLRQGEAHELFAHTLEDFVPRSWSAAIPGQLLVAMKVAVEQSRGKDYSEARIAQWFAGGLIGGRVSGGGRAFSDFRIHADGYSRLLLLDDALLPGQAGRTLQRLLEIETYRMLAMLAFPLARELLPHLREEGQRLLDLTTRLTDPARHESDEALLDALTTMAAELEKLHASTHMRFNATRAYHGLIRFRLEQLREQSIEGIPTFERFLYRRLEPALATVESVTRSIEHLCARINQANNLLITRIDVRREQQNQALLASMDRRSQQQLRLQQTVEGLSVVAITNYVISLLDYLLRGISTLVPLNQSLALTLAIPVVGYFVYLGIKEIRERITAQTNDSFS